MISFVGSSYFNCLDGVLISNQTYVSKTGMPRKNNGQTHPRLSRLRILRPRCKLLSHPQATRRRERERRNDRSSAANWPASKSDSIRPLARSRSSFSSEWAQNSISLSLSHNLRYFTPPLTLFRFASSSSSSSSVLRKMISFTFVHLNAAMVCPPPPPPSRSL